jgi:hypothetical protein
VLPLNIGCFSLWSLSFERVLSMREMDRMALLNNIRYLRLKTSVIVPAILLALPPASFIPEIPCLLQAHSGKAIADGRDIMSLMPPLPGNSFSFSSALPVSK